MPRGGGGWRPITAWMPRGWSGGEAGRRRDGHTSFPVSLLPSVSPVSENQVASSEGYVLFYQLVQEPPRCL